MLETEICRDRQGSYRSPLQTSSSHTSYPTLESDLKIADIKANAYSMPFVNPSFPKGPYHFVNREFFIISYRTDEKLLRQMVPEPLTIDDPIVSFEFIHTHKRESSEQQFSASSDKETSAPAAKKTAAAKKAPAENVAAKKRVVKKTAAASTTNTASTSTKPSDNRKQPRQAPK